MAIENLKGLHSAENADRDLKQDQIIGSLETDGGSRKKLIVELKSTFSGLDEAGENNLKSSINDTIKKTLDKLRLPPTVDATEEVGVEQTVGVASAETAYNTENADTPAPTTEAVTPPTYNLAEAMQTSLTAFNDSKKGYTPENYNENFSTTQLALIALVSAHMQLEGAANGDKLDDVVAYICANDFEGKLVTAEVNGKSVELLIEPVKVIVDRKIAAEQEKITKEIDQTIIDNENKIEQLDKDIQDDSNIPNEDLENRASDPQLIEEQEKFNVLKETYEASREKATEQQGLADEQYEAIGVDKLKLTALKGKRDAGGELSDQDQSDLASLPKTISEKSKECRSSYEQANTLWKQTKEAFNTMNEQGEVLKKFGGDGSVDKTPVVEEIPVAQETPAGVTPNEEAVAAVEGGDEGVPAGGVIVDNEVESGTSRVNTPSANVNSGPESADRATTAEQFLFGEDHSIDIAGLPDNVTSNETFVALYEEFGETVDIHLDALNKIYDKTISKNGEPDFNSLFKITDGKMSLSETGKEFVTAKDEFTGIRDAYSEFLDQLVAEKLVDNNSDFYNRVQKKIERYNVIIANLGLFDNGPVSKDEVNIDGVNIPGETEKSTKTPERIQEKTPDYISTLTKKLNSGEDLPELYKSIKENYTAYTLNGEEIYVKKSNDKKFEDKYVLPGGFIDQNKSELVKEELETNKVEWFSTSKLLNAINANKNLTIVRQDILDRGSEEEHQGLLEQICSGDRLSQDDGGFSAKLRKSRNTFDSNKLEKNLKNAYKKKEGIRRLNNKQILEIDEQSNAIKDTEQFVTVKNGVIDFSAFNASKYKFDYVKVGLPSADGSKEYDFVFMHKDDLGLLEPSEKRPKNTAQQRENQALTIDSFKYMLQEIGIDEETLTDNDIDYVGSDRNTQTHSFTFGKTKTDFSITVQGDNMLYDYDGIPTDKPVEIHVDGDHNQVLKTLAEYDKEFALQTKKYNKRRTKHDVISDEMRKKGEELVADMEKAAGKDKEAIAFN